MVSRTVAVLPLQCQHCGGPLDGLPDDVVFFCRECEVGHEATLDGFEVHPVSWWQPRTEHRGQRIYLPFWAFTCKVQLRCDDEKKLRKYADLQDRERIYVKGFSLLNSFAAGNPGLDLTGAGVRPRSVKLPRPYPRLVGCRRSSWEAATFLRLILLHILDRQADVTGVRLELEVDDLHIAAIPFFDDGRDLASSVMDKRYPAPLFNDIEGLRQTARGR